MKTRLAFLLLAGVLVPAVAGASCICFPCPDCDLQSAGQLNFVVMDREAGLVHLVPNIRIVGEADDFALIIPTPAIPTLSPMDAAIWDQALALTQPTFVQRTAGGGTGCGQTTDSAVFVPDLEDADDGGVTVIGEQTVGAFTAFTISGSDPAKLIAWLETNGYDLSGLTPELVAPLVEQGWLFTAFKLNPNATVPDRWDANVDPVLVSFESEDFEVPLSLMAINRAPSFPMAFFVVDDHRTELPGFDETYANSISTSEHAAIAERYPALADFMKPGRFVTRLDRTFTLDDPMQGSIHLERASNDDEFRRVIYSSLNSFPGMLLLLSGLLLGFERVRRRVARG